MDSTDRLEEAAWGRGRRLGKGTRARQAWETYRRGRSESAGRADGQWRTAAAGRPEGQEYSGEKPPDASRTYKEQKEGHLQEKYREDDPAEENNLEKLLREEMRDSEKGNEKYSDNEHSPSGDEKTEAKKKALLPKLRKNMRKA